MTAEILPIEPARLLAAALDYAKRGWFIAPLHSVRTRAAGWACTCSLGPACGNAGKHPRLKTGYRPSRDAVEVRAWWEEFPDSNIAIFPGPSGLVILDIDPRNGGDESLAEMEAKYGELPRGPTSLTGGGGQHLLFWRPPTGNEVRSCVLAPGVDLKGQSGYIVAPPSRHLSGRLYGWDCDRDLDVPLPEPPPWLISMARSPKAVQAEDHPDGVMAGLLGQAFAASGMLGGGVGPNKAAVVCPWEHEHTSGHRFDSSTVVFAPTVGRRLGWFHCLHSHCAHRQPPDVLAALPPDAVKAAQERLGIADLGAGWHVMPPWPEDAEVAAATASFVAPAAAAPDETNWRRGLRVGSDGQLDRSPGNAVLLLVNHDDWAGTLVYDTFRDRYYWGKDAPEGIHGMPRPRRGQQVDDHHTVYVQQWLGKFTNCTAGVESIKMAIAAACHANEVHPVRDYLNGLEWDKTPRLANAPLSYLGARDTQYARQCFRWWLISAVARIMDPGCQVDHMLILEGPQGVRKSTALKILGGPWVLESLPSLRDGIRASESIMGKWIVIVNELDALKGVDHTRVKDFLTIREDSFRGAYKAFVTDRPRQCVFAGTTNERSYLTDATGARRFWPIATDRLDIEKLSRDRDQLWAEALTDYRIGAKWWPSAQTEEAQVFEEQEQRHELDEWEARICLWCAGREGFTTGDVLIQALGIVEPRDWTRMAQARVGHVLQKHKWRPQRVAETDSAGKIVRVRRYYRAPEVWQDNPRGWEPDR